MATIAGRKYKVGDIVVVLEKGQNKEEKWFKNSIGKLQKIIATGRQGYLLANKHWYTENQLDKPDFKREIHKILSKYNIRIKGRTNGQE